MDALPFKIYGRSMNARASLIPKLYAPSADLEISSSKRIASLSLKTHSSMTCCKPMMWSLILPVCLPVLFCSLFSKRYDLYERAWSRSELLGLSFLRSSYFGPREQIREQSGKSKPSSDDDDSEIQNSGLEPPSPAPLEWLRLPFNFLMPRRPWS